MEIGRDNRWAATCSHSGRLLQGMCIFAECLSLPNTLQGWYIPKNTWVQGNVWAIHRNENEFPEPDRFYPDRFFEGNPLHRPFPNDKGYMTFGWGRRVCSGQGLAEQGTFLTVARLLWAFNIQKALDQAGNEIPVDIFDYT